MESKESGQLKIRFLERRGAFLETDTNAEALAK